jgi:hypothetical protein
MADSGIKKVIIKKKDLPISGNDLGQYLVKFRIVSEDGNRQSAWSPINRVTFTQQPLPSATAVGAITTVGSKNIFKINWENPLPGEITSFDVFVQLATDSQILEEQITAWKYTTTASTTSYEYILPDTVLTSAVTGANALIQIPTASQQPDPNNDSLVVAWTGFIDIPTV